MKTFLKKTRKDAIVEYLDHQIPVTQLKGPKGKESVRLKCATYLRYTDLSKQESENKMRHLLALDRLKRYGR